MAAAPIGNFVQPELSFKRSAGVRLMRSIHDTLQNSLVESQPQSQQSTWDVSTCLRCLSSK